MGIDLMSDDAPRGGKDGLLPEGWHEVTVGAHREFKANSGNTGVEYDLSNAEGKSKASFYLTPKSKFRLKLFAQTAGIPEVKLRNFDFADLRGKRIRVEVRKSDKGYLEVTDWASADAPAPDDEWGE